MRRVLESRGRKTCARERARVEELSRESALESLVFSLSGNGPNCRCERSPEQRRAECSCDGPADGAVVPQQQPAQLKVHLRALVCEERFFLDAPQLESAYTLGMS